MKKLILMRHAKAQKDAPSGEDFDRELTDRGLEEALIVAKALKTDGHVPDLALVSASARTKGTFAQVQSVMGEVKAEVLDALYNAHGHNLRHAIEAREDSCDCLLVVAHNPGVHQLVVDYLIEGAQSLSTIDKIRTGYPTATATVFDIDVAGRPTYAGVYTAK